MIFGNKDEKGCKLRLFSTIAKIVGVDDDCFYDKNALKC